MAHKRPRSTLEPGAYAAEFVSYGTAIPPLDTTVRDDGSYIPLWKQEVRDERGRKRLHGAFTGGFSAGYFNTVGSKEGWTPAAFKSSRAARATKKPAAPEDFMDDEDIREAEETKVLETNPDFLSLGEGRDVGSPLDFLIPAVQNTRGYTLLRKMGWRDGCGIGPKNKHQILSRAHFSDATKNKPMTGAPPIYLPKRKDDERGLGALSDAPLQEKHKDAWDSGSKSAFVPTASTTTGPRRVRGSAFGVGILNDDDDEDDTYEIRPQAVCNKIIDTDQRKTRIKARPTAKHVFVSKKKSPSTICLKKCHDGRLPMTGFRLASTLPVEQKYWPMPSVPVEWNPASISPAVQTNSNSKHLSLDPVGRAKLLDEALLPGKSVFNYISANSRDRLASLTGRMDLPPGLGQTSESLNRPNIESTTNDLVPYLEPYVASAALDHLSMPYAEDPDKRKRYRIFLEIKAGKRDGIPERKSGMHLQDWIREMGEFVATARVFRPLAGSMANRFTSAGSTTGRNMSARVSSDHNPLILDTPRTIDTAGEAADMGMYGPLTRMIVNFKPSHLLCKRFGMPGLPSNSDSLGNLSEGKITQSGPVPLEASLSSTLDAASVGQETIKTVNPDVINEGQKEERAAEEVFLAVFGDDD